MNHGEMTIEMRVREDTELVEYLRTTDIPYSRLRGGELLVGPITVYGKREILDYIKNVSSAATRDYYARIGPSDYK